jgi:hypothetical protein
MQAMQAMHRRSVQRGVSNHCGSGRAGQVGTCFQPSQRQKYAPGVLKQSCCAGVCKWGWGAGAREAGQGGDRRALARKWHSQRAGGDAAATCESGRGWLHSLWAGSG